jgi:hypothetical protein
MSLPLIALEVVRLGRPVGGRVCCRFGGRAGRGGRWRRLGGEKADGSCADVNGEGEGALAYSICCVRGTYEVERPKAGEDALRDREDDRRKGCGRDEPRSSSSVNGLGDRDVKGGWPNGRDLCKKSNVGRLSQHLTLGTSCCLPSPPSGYTSRALSSS